MDVFNDMARPGNNIGIAAPEVIILELLGTFNNTVRLRGKFLPHEGANT